MNMHLHMLQETVSQRTELMISTWMPTQVSALQKARSEIEWQPMKRHQLPDIDEYRVPFANTSVDLMHALTMNPRMKVLIHQGYFDLAVPYRTVEYVLDHLDLAPELRANVRIEYYEAGHMMYVHPPSIAKMKRDLSAFIESTTRS